MYTQTTNNIKITVLQAYLQDYSEPGDNHYVWAYTIQVENLGDKTVQLLNRHWRITDAQGHLQEVRGEGVIGKQPVLKPGQAFQYTSGTALPTPSGIMAGTYEMTAEESGEKFEVAVPAFSLDSPYQLGRPN